MDTRCPSVSFGRQYAEWRCAVSFHGRHKKIPAPDRGITYLIRALRVGYVYVKLMSVGCAYP